MVEVNELIWEVANKGAKKLRQGKSAHREINAISTLPFPTITQAWNKTLRRINQARHQPEARTRALFDFRVLDQALILSHSKQKGRVEFPAAISKDGRRQIDMRNVLLRSSGFKMPSGIATPRNVKSRVNRRISRQMATRRLIFGHPWAIREMRTVSPKNAEILDKFLKSQSRQGFAKALGVSPNNSDFLLRRAGGMLWDFVYGAKKPLESSFSDLRAHFLSNPADLLILKEEAYQTYALMRRLCGIGTAAHSVKMAMDAMAINRATIIRRVASTRKKFNIVGPRKLKAAGE